MSGLAYFTRLRLIFSVKLSIALVRASIWITSRSASASRSTIRARIRAVSDSQVPRIAR